MISKFFQKVIALLNVLAAIALLLSMLAPYVSPTTTKTLAIFGLGMPYFIIINILFVLFWLNFKRKYWIISLSILLIISGMSIRSRKTKDSPITETQNTFSIMSYNVRVFDLYNWTKNKESRDNIFSLIRNESPDIICFQEYFNSSNKDYFPVHDSLMRNQSFKYYHVHYTNIIKGNKFGIATYSNHKIINKQSHTFEGTNNLFISSDIVIKKDTIRLLNCHLESIRLNQDDYNLMDSLRSIGEKRRRSGMKGIVRRIQQAYIKRTAQAEHINAYIADSPYPVVCSGDFNDTPNSYTYNKIASSLNDSYLTTNSFHGGTYYRFFPSFRIDFLLYSNELSCSDFETINIELSDHKPIKGTYHIVSRK